MERSLKNTLSSLDFIVHKTLIIIFLLSNLFVSRAMSMYSEKTANEQHPLDQEKTYIAFNSLSSIEKAMEVNLILDNLEQPLLCKLQTPCLASTLNNDEIDVILNNDEIDVILNNDEIDVMAKTLTPILSKFQIQVPTPHINLTEALIYNPHLVIEACREREKSREAFKNPENYETQLYEYYALVELKKVLCFISNIKP